MPQHGPVLPVEFRAPFRLTNPLKGGIGIGHLCLNQILTECWSFQDSASSTSSATPGCAHPAILELTTLSLHPHAPQATHHRTGRTASGIAAEPGGAPARAQAPHPAG